MKNRRNPQAIRTNRTESWGEVILGAIGLFATLFSLFALLAMFAP